MLNLPNRSEATLESSGMVTEASLLLLPLDGIRQDILLAASHQWGKATGVTAQIAALPSRQVRGQGQEEWY